MNARPEASARLARDAPQTVGSIITRPYKFDPKSNLVDVRMGRLRRKIDAPQDPPMIANVRGKGFILHIEDGHAALEQAR